MTEPDEWASGMRQRLLQQVSIEEYCELMSAFPTGVAIVTALDAAGRPCGMTCSSLTSVTLAPPTLLVCLRIGSRTLNAVSECGAFAVNLLHAKAHRAAELFSRPAQDRFAQIRWTCSGSGLPWLCDDAFALAECRLTRRFDVGDHMVVFGEVSHIAHTADTPLLHGMRRFASWCPDGHPAAAANPGTS